MSTSAPPAVDQSSSDAAAAAVGSPHTEPVPLDEAASTASDDSASAASSPRQGKLTLVGRSWQVHKVLGKGCSGTVYFVRDEIDRTPLALKVIRKKRVLAQGDVVHTLTEQKVLKACKSKFVVNLFFSAQDDTNLYLGLEFQPGGDLAGLLATSTRLDRDLVRFLTCDIVIALSALHQLRVVYRDLKPENILITERGHVVLTDFGLSKALRGSDLVEDHVPDTASTFCGTAEYLAPEVLLGQPYSRAVDSWALGVVLYEMMAGEVPFAAEDHAQMYNKVLHDEFEFDPALFEPLAQSMIRGLLVRDPALRLLPDERRFRSHPYFVGIDWTVVAHQGYAAPYVPELKRPTHGNAEPDLRHFDETFLSMTPSLGRASVPSEVSLGQSRSALQARGEPQREGVGEMAEDDDDVFRGYDYVNPAWIYANATSSAPVSPPKVEPDSEASAAATTASSELETADVDDDEDAAEQDSDDNVDQRAVINIAGYRASRQSERSHWSGKRSTSAVSLPHTRVSSVDADWQLLPHAETREGHVMPSARNGRQFWTAKAKGLRPSRSLFGLSSIRSREQVQRSIVRVPFGAASWSRSWKKVVTRRRAN
ncbi:hypothetical protein ACM66B_001276 [Microbotryomycetes sp. NB124-2]